MDGNAPPTCGIDLYTTQLMFKYKSDALNSLPMKFGKIENSLANSKIL